MHNNKKKILVIIQARMSATRLPGKVLMEIEGKPMLWHVVERLKYSRKIDGIVLAIPDTKKNNKLENFAIDNNIKYFRGSEENVLFRYYETAKEFKCDVIVRVTSDCPLIDFEVADKAVDMHLSSEADYTANILKRTYPRGLDVEVLNFKALEKSFKEANGKQHCEHVTLYIREHPEKFKRVSVENRKDFSHLRWTVDEKEDMEFIREIYKRLHKKGKIFLMAEIIKVLAKEPKLLEINKNIKRKKIR